MDFDDIWHKYSEVFRIQFACFSFHVGSLFINCSSFRQHTENNVNFGVTCLLSKHAKVNEMQFLKHTPKLIVFGTHNQHSADI